MAKETDAFDPQMWKIRASGRYASIGWVGAKGILEKIANLGQLAPGQTFVDIGTGSQAVLDFLLKESSDSMGVGFDISPEMLQEGADIQAKKLFVADSYAIPLSCESMDLATARMVFHHLANVNLALAEAKRILRVGGKLIICEYVVPDQETWGFERRVFDIKEPNRSLWTGPQLLQLMSGIWKSQGVLDYALMPLHSVHDWMSKSGLSTEIQEQVLNCYLDLKTGNSSIIDKMGISYTENDDALVNRLFAYVTLIK